MGRGRKSKARCLTRVHKSKLANTLSLIHGKQDVGREPIQNRTIRGKEPSPVVDLQSLTSKVTLSEQEDTESEDTKEKLAVR